MPRTAGEYNLTDGVYTGRSICADQKNRGVTISTQYMDFLFNDIADGITDSLSRTGNGGMLANLSMGNNKIVSLAAAGALADAPTYGQLLGSMFYGNATTGGTAPNYTVTINPTGLTYTDYLTIGITVHAGAPSGPITVNLNGLGAKTVFLLDIACPSLVFQAGKYYRLRYSTAQNGWVIDIPPMLVGGWTPTAAQGNLPNSSTTLGPSAVDLGGCVYIINGSAITISFEANITPISNVNYLQLSLPVSPAASWSRKMIAGMGYSPATVSEVSIVSDLSKFWVRFVRQGAEVAGGGTTTGIFSSGTAYNIFSTITYRMG
jgi:hypothetical protein